MEEQNYEVEIKNVSFLCKLFSWSYRLFRLFSSKGIVYLRRLNQA